MATIGHATEPEGADAWMAHMRRGELAAAWRLSDAALRARAGRPCWHWPRHLQYVWDGRPLAGRRVLVRCYHGLGDTIQFIRYAPLLRAVAAQVIVWAPAPLLPLARTARGIDRLLALHDGTPEVDYDADVEVMELAHVFRSALDTLPAEVPYLHVPAAGVRRRGGLAAGLVWRAGDWDPRRSLPFEALAPLLAVPGVDWYILQQDAAAAGWRPGAGTLAASPDPWALACTMRALDLVVSVDSMPAHLAGALGVPVWTLLHAQCDWRWMERRADSPWYPTMRLFRQDTPGVWEAPLVRLAAALRRAVAAGARHG